MPIVSWTFFSFVFLVLVVYYLLPRKQQNIFLLVSSYGFYFFCSWKWALLLFIITLCNYFLGQRLGTKKSSGRRWLHTALIFNVLAWATFKYYDFFVPEILLGLAKIGIGKNTISLEIIFPLGLSFYILQAISYQVDVYRRQTDPASTLVDFALYLAYFPKLTVGPIERARSFLSILARKRYVDSELVIRSFTLIVIGLIRKIVFADTLLAMIPKDLSTSPASFASSELWLWMGVYAIGIYNDFAGYTAIVRGLSGFFGIELSQNFAQPFFSRNLTEFWNRWHKSLSFWLRDYIYFPLSRALVRRYRGRSGWLNILFPPMVTMLVSGLWHGAGINFLLWGGLIGFCLVGERLISLWSPSVSCDQRSEIYQWSARIVVFMTLMFCCVPFVNQDIASTLSYWRGMVCFTGLKIPLLRPLIVILPSMIIDWIQYRSGDELVFLQWPIWARSLCLSMALLLVFLFGLAEVSAPFIYQEF